MIDKGFERIGNISAITREVTDKIITKCIITYTW